MKTSEVIRAVASFGIKFEPNEIIDYIVIRLSVLVSISAAIIVVVCIEKVAGVWSAFLIGFGVYAACMYLCAANLLGSRQTH